MIKDTALLMGLTSPVRWLYGWLEYLISNFGGARVGVRTSSTDHDYLLPVLDIRQERRALRGKSKGIRVKKDALDVSGIV